MSKDEISDEYRRERFARWEDLGLDPVISSTMGVETLLAAARPS